MNPEENQEDSGSPEESTGEGNEVETISIPKAEYEKLNQTLGSLKREVKDLKKPKDEPKETPKTESNEPDYGKLAYLHARQITHDEDIKLVNDEANRLKLPLHAVLEMEHVKNNLKRNLEKREAADGLPSQGNRSGSKLKDVDYWVAKGGLPDDQELAEKVVAARERQAVGKKFADEMFNS